MCVLAFHFNPWPAFHVVDFWGAGFFAPGSCPLLIRLGEDLVQLMHVPDTPDEHVNTLVLENLGVEILLLPIQLVMACKGG